jgi:hypothetical protein
MPMLPGEAAPALSCPACYAPVSRHPRPWWFRCVPCGGLIWRAADIGSLQRAIIRRDGLPAAAVRIRWPGGDITDPVLVAAVLACWVCAGPVSSHGGGYWRFDCAPCATAMRPWPDEVQLQQALRRTGAAVAMRRMAGR